MTIRTVEHIDNELRAAVQQRDKAIAKVNRLCKERSDALANLNARLTEV